MSDSTKKEQKEEKPLPKSQSEQLDKKENTEEEHKDVKPEEKKTEERVTTNAKDSSKAPEQTKPEDKPTAEEHKDVKPKEKMTEEKVTTNAKDSSKVPEHTEPKTPEQSKPKVPVTKPEDQPTAEEHKDFKPEEKITVENVTTNAKKSSKVPEEMVTKPEDQPTAVMGTSRFPFTPTLSGNLKISPSIVVYEDSDIAILAKDSQRISVDTVNCLKPKSGNIVQVVCPNIQDSESKSQPSLPESQYFTEQGSNLSSEEKQISDSFLSKEWCSSKTKLTIIVDNKPMDVNRRVLCEHSDVLRRLLRDNDIADVLVLHDLDWATFNTMYQWMWDKEQPIVCTGRETIGKLLKGATKLGVTELVGECMGILKTAKHKGLIDQRVSDDNMEPDTIVISNVVIKKEEENNQERDREMSLPSFLALSAYEVFELLSRDDLGVQSEQHVLDCALLWLYHQWPEREHYAETLLSTVRWPLMTSQELLDFSLDNYHEELRMRPLTQTMLADALACKLAQKKRCSERASHLCGKKRSASGHIHLPQVYQFYRDASEI